MTYMLRTRQLTKLYGGVEVVSKVNMNVRRGEIYGFLGPNGAGKTTLMKMITGLVRSTEGEIEIMGEKLQTQSYEMLKKIGSIIEYPRFYERLSAEQNLELHCEYMGYYNKEAIAESLQLVNLVNVENKPVKEFSLGMKQRLGIARAIITKPEFLILDEPVNGLDPIGMHEIRDLFFKLSRQYGMTLIISSHILAEMEQIADTIGVIREGRLVVEAPLEDIRNKQTDHLELMVSNHTGAAFVLENELNLTNFRWREDKGVFQIYDHKVNQSDIVEAMVRRRIRIDSIYQRNQSLEDYFLQLMEGVEVNG
ncbi:ABC transporter ATP-binding protein [Gracilibacillus dipsosauri]|uniref:ABC transporter ATP-binding protein n=1 Tax=Gracilibacillus dipsosauri TaxID=178340 RepID=UPI00240A6BCC